MFKNIISRIVLIVLFIYTFILIYMYLAQSKILYPGNKEISNIQKANKIIPELKEYYLKYNDNIENNKIKIFFTHSKNNDYFVFFHGNAENLLSSIRLAKKYYNKGYGVLACTYPGFDNNQGISNANNLYKAGFSCLDFLKQYNIKDSNIIIHAYSLGANIASFLSKDRNFKAIILISPLGSALEIAKKNYFYLPVSLILKDHLNTYESITLLEAPLLIFHNKYDKVVPFKQALKLYQAASSSVKILYKINYLNNYSNGHDPYAYNIDTYIFNFLNMIENIIYKQDIITLDFNN